MRFIVQFLVVIAALGTMVSTLSVYPHELAYFNELAGGPANGQAHLLHSNLDWGQDLLRAAEWQKKNVPNTQMFFLLKSSFDPRVLGIKGSDLRTPYLCETLMEKAKGDGCEIFISRQTMLEESACLSKLDMRIVKPIGMSIILVSIRDHKIQE